MAKYAILNNNRTKVINVTENAPADLVQTHGWVACPDWVGIGDSYTEGTNTFTKESPNPNKAKREIKKAVRELLRRTDWTQIPDNLGQNKRDNWATYRTALKALIAQAEVDPFNIVFPEPPGDLDEDGL